MASTNPDAAAGGRRMVFIGAHPDDETFGIGGSLATYARRGVGVYIVCATRGEVGEIAEPSLATPETLAYVRELELRCACGTLRAAPAAPCALSSPPSWATAIRAWPATPGTTTPARWPGPAPRR